MNLPSALLVALVAFFASHPSVTHAQAKDAPEAAGVVEGDLTVPPQGSLPAQIAGAVVGDVLGIGVTVLLVAPLVCIACEGDEGASEATVYGVLTTGWLLRSVLVGSFTSWFSGGRHGPGRTYAAMLGALPGVALSSAAWLSADRMRDAFIPLVVTGHVLSMAGSVAGYRYSARRAHRRAQVTPSAFADKGSFGIAVLGSF